MARLHLERSCVIRRPIDVCRQHFLDFDHHIARGVHRSIHYTILRGGERQRVRSKIRVLGLPKVDEIEVYEDKATGDVVQDFLVGDFAGGNIRVRFTAVDAGTTRLDAVFDAPLTGLNALLAPLIRRVVGKITDRTIEEDRVDLEAGYTPRRAGSSLARSAA